MSYLAANFLIAFAALIIERLIGYPDGLYKIIRHPVVWMGAVLSVLDRLLNRATFSNDTKRASGAFTLLIVIAATLVIVLPLSLWLRSFVGGLLLEAIVASAFLAQKSLRDFVRAVSQALDKGIEHARSAVSHIVGRDPSQLDESEVAKAAIESLAENTADGVIAPLFWMMLFGLPGIAVYKAINTADSMLGYRNEKYQDFGWASAKTDDVVNYLAARLCGWLFVATAFLKPRWQGEAAFQAMMRDAPNHVSPNAGWSEAAMAGALGLKLGGSRAYEGHFVDLATMGDGRDQLARADISEALQFYRWSMTLAAIILGLVTLLTMSLL